MADKEPSSSQLNVSKPPKDRRSGIDRRWIKSPYQGEERRSGKNRRQGNVFEDQLLPVAPSPINSEDLERLLVSATLQLEAITRLLLQNGLVDQDEFQRVLDEIRAEYQSQNKA